MRRAIWVCTFVSLAHCTGSASSFGLGETPGPQSTVDAGSEPNGVPPDAAVPSLADSGAASEPDGGLPPVPDAGVPDAGPPGIPDLPAVSADGNGSFDIGPNYSDSPDFRAQNGVPQGKLYEFSMSSKDSTRYPGVNGPYTRTIRVFIPTQYVDGTPAALLIATDGGPVDAVRNVLNNLIATRKMPVVIAIFVDNGGGDGQGSQRGFEYDSVTKTYAEFVEFEVLPAVLKRPDILKDRPDLTFTKDPNLRATMGCSSGGAAAFTMGWFRPDLFRRLLTTSGTFVNQDPKGPYPLGAWSYHNSPDYTNGLIVKTERKQLRVFLEVGENDLNLNGLFNDTHHNWMTANREMHKALAYKDYPVRFLFAKQAGHCDGRMTGQILPEAMEWVWRGAPIP